MSSGKADQLFGDYFKVLEFVTPKTPPVQVNITIRMNSCGRRFQASIGMVELKCANNPNGKVS